MKIFTPQLSDTKGLIAAIKTAHEQSAGKWLYIRDIETGDKRANFGLLLHGMITNIVHFENINFIRNVREVFRTSRCRQV